MYVFVGGTPAAGKSYTVKDFIRNSGIDIAYISIDDLRDQFKDDPALKYWVDFFWEKDEQEYWQNSSYEEDIQNLIQQSEAFWPKVKEKINSVIATEKNAILEGVNLLPHLVKEYPQVPALFIYSDDEQTLLERIKQDPRWGSEDHLQRMEARFFIEYDARFIKTEAPKHGYWITDSSVELTQKLQELFSKELASQLPS